MTELELEKTYLVKKLPADLEKFPGKFPRKEIVDIYIPAGAEHPTLRIRKKSTLSPKEDNQYEMQYEMTKKSPAKGDDSSEQMEHTICLTNEEYDSLRNVHGKKVRKIRYEYPYKYPRKISTGKIITAEIGVFQDDLEGLVLVDFEFKNSKDKNAFRQPDFCLTDVTQDKTFAGGMLCGKKYSDIEPRLKMLGYEPLFLTFL